MSGIELEGLLENCAEFSALNAGGDQAHGSGIASLLRERYDDAWNAGGLVEFDYGARLVR